MRRMRIACSVTKAIYIYIYTHTHTHTHTLSLSLSLSLSLAFPRQQWLRERALALLHTYIVLFFKLVGGNQIWCSVGSLYELHIVSLLLTCMSFLRSSGRGWNCCQLETQSEQYNSDIVTPRNPANGAEVKVVTVALSSSRAGAVTRHAVSESSGKIELTQLADEIGENEARVLGTESNSAHGVLGEPTQSAQRGTAERLASSWETERISRFFWRGGVCFIFCLVSSLVLISRL